MEASVDRTRPLTRAGDQLSEQDIDNFFSRISIPAPRFTDTPPIYLPVPVSLC